MNLTRPNNSHILLSQIALNLRLPMQVLFIYIAFQFTFTRIFICLIRNIYVRILRASDEAV